MEKSSEPICSKLTPSNESESKIVKVIEYYIQPFASMEVFRATDIHEVWRSAYLSSPSNWIQNIDGFKKALFQQHTQENYFQRNRGIRKPQTSKAIGKDVPIQTLPTLESLGATRRNPIASLFADLVLNPLWAFSEIGRCPATGGDIWIRNFVWF